MNNFKYEKELVERDCRAKWDRDAGLRAEFGGDFDSYCAYVVARDKGLVRVRGQQEGR